MAAHDANDHEDLEQDEDELDAALDLAADRLASDDGRRLTSSEVAAILDRLRQEP